MTNPSLNLTNTIILDDAKIKALALGAGPDYSTRTQTIIIPPCSQYSGKDTMNIPRGFSVTFNYPSESGATYTVDSASVGAKFRFSYADSYSFYVSADVSFEEICGSTMNRFESITMKVPYPINLCESSHAGKGIQVFVDCMTISTLATDPQSSLSITAIYDTIVVPQFSV